MADMKRILDNKGYTFYFIAPYATVMEALRMLDQRRVGLLLVMDGERLEGVFSERDAVRLLAQSGPAALERPLHEVMSSPRHTVTLATKVDACMSLMSQQGIRHVPVLDGAMVVGVVSIKDVVRELVMDKEAEIRGLENQLVSGEFPT